MLAGSVEVNAQSAPRQPAPTSATPTSTSPVWEVPANVNSVNVLIIALDDLADQIRRVRAAGDVPTLPGADVATTPNLVPNTTHGDGVIAPAPAPPIPELAPNVELPAIRPAAFNYAPRRPFIEWRALAQKQKPDKKSGKKTDKDADLFRALPEAPPIYPAIRRPRADDSVGALSPQPQTPEGAETSAISPVAPGNARPGETSPLLLPGSLTAGEADAMVARPPGAAQIAAAPLRRALMRAGFADVLNTAVDGSAIVRALNSRRLTSRVIDNLQMSTARLVWTSLGVTPGSADGGGKAPDGVQAAAMQAAAQVGQALGYRAVLVLGVLPPELAGTSAGNQPAVDGGIPAAQSTLNANPLALPEGGSSAGGGRPATFAVLVVDALRETGEVMIFDETGAGELSRNEAAAATGAGVVTKTLSAWPVVMAEDKRRYADNYLTAARAVVASGNLEAAQDKLNQVLAIDPNRAEAALMLGDVLAAIDPAGSISSYRRAVAQNANDGATWAKIAIAYTVGKVPDWPRALDAGHKALAAKFDSAELRQAMATAQLGRAELFRRFNRIDKAEDAELDARQHLDRALTLAPEDPGITRLMTRQLVVQGRYREAIKALDRIAVQYPDDAEIQMQYATSLLEVGGREEDAFVAWARVWKLTGQQAAAMDTSRYRRLSEGFDQRVASLGKKAKQLTSAVASNSTPREAALLQLSRYKEDMTAAVTAIKVMQPGFDGQGGAVHASRIFAADLMSQALEAHQLYLETGQEIYRTRGGELNRQSMMTLNAARGGRS